MSGKRYQPLKIGAESFICGVRKSWYRNGVPFVPVQAVAHWLGKPYDEAQILKLACENAFIYDNAIEIDGCGVALSPFGIALLVFEIEPPAPAELKLRASSMLVDWWAGREGNSVPLHKVFGS